MQLRICLLNSTIFYFSLSLTDSDTASLEMGFDRLLTSSTEGGSPRKSQSEERLSLPANNTDPTSPSK
ncbi:hypothetical protein Ciccas_000783, partial [Cichlidogyrus casuarinus]